MTGTEIADDDLLDVIEEFIELRLVGFRVCADLWAGFAACPCGGPACRVLLTFGHPDAEATYRASVQQAEALVAKEPR